MVTLSIKRLAARIGIAALLFTQFAVAVHACPLTAAPVDYSHAAMADNLHAAMPGCEESGSGIIESGDTGNTNLCMQHCQTGSQSVQTTPQLTVPAIAMVALAIIEPAPSVCDSPTQEQLTLLERATSPPPLLRFCVLRI
jgi:hypothetical protein